MTISWTQLNTITKVMRQYGKRVVHFAPNGTDESVLCHIHTGEAVIPRCFTSKENGELVEVPHEGA